MNQKDIKIIKNFLSKPYFDELQALFMGWHMPWFFNENSLREVDDKSFMFTQAIFF